MKESRSRHRLLFFMALLFCMGCAKAPVTGRTQINLVSRPEELALGKQAALQMFRSTRTCRDSAQAATVRRVGKAIAAQADVPDANWSFNCIEDGSFNALCLPGGVVFVNSGVFRYVENDDQLAGVIGHEVGHAMARHGVENLSRGRLAAASVAVVALGVGVAAQSADAMDATANLLSATALYAFILPGSREQEYEADKLGLILMAKAGYDPAQYPLLWSHLIEQGILKNKTDFAQTHPADAKRLEALHACLPEARRLAGLSADGQTAVAQAQPAADGQRSASAPDERQEQKTEMATAQTASASALVGPGQSRETPDQNAQPASVGSSEQTPASSPDKPDQATVVTEEIQDRFLAAPTNWDAEDVSTAQPSPRRNKHAKKKTASTRRAQEDAAEGE